MKYRIKHEEIHDENGNVTHKYFPQWKFWGYTNFNVSPSNYKPIFFDTEEEAVEFIQKEKAKIIPYKKITYIKV